MHLLVWLRCSVGVSLLWDLAVMCLALINYLFPRPWWHTGKESHIKYYLAASYSSMEETRVCCRSSLHLVQFARFLYCDLPWEKDAFVFLEVVLRIRARCIPRGSHFQLSSFPESGFSSPLQEEKHPSFKQCDSAVVAPCGVCVGRRLKGATWIRIIRKTGPCPQNKQMRYTSVTFWNFSVIQS